MGRRAIRLAAEVAAVVAADAQKAKAPKKAAPKGKKGKTPWWTDTLKKAKKAPAKQGTTKR